MDLEEFKEDQIEKEINALSHYKMAGLIRFASSGHKYFDISKPYYKYFKKRFAELGGWTPAISKQLGW